MKSRIHTAFRLPILSAITALIVLSCSERSDFVAITGLAQGGTYTVKINMRGIGISPREIKEGIDSILTTVDTTLSGYNKGSMLSRFNRGEKIRPNGMFFDIYDSARNLWTCTGGALDCAAGPLFDAWGFGFTNDTLPSREQVSSLLSSCGMKHLAADLRASIGPDGLLDPAKVSLSGILPHLNYNAIAQGYSSDLVASYLRSLGIKDMLVDIGEIFCDGLNPGGRGWTIAIDKPVDGNDTPGKDIFGIWQSKGGPCGVVTSANNRRFYVRDGVKYSHTIDPRTGFPTQHNLLSATIIAPDAMLADAYATACMVLGVDASRRFILSNPDIEACLIYRLPGGSMESWTSPGFNMVD